MNKSVVAGGEFSQEVPKILKEDVVQQSVKVTVKKCDGGVISAELDLLLKDQVLELKNWERITPGNAKTIRAQVQRQMEVVAQIPGNPATHGGVVIGQTTKLSQDALEVFKEEGIQVWRKIEGELRAVISASD
ncbi:MAG: hypothetical protein ACYC6Y_18750 [Thermoguttaceae bacterium]